MNCPEAVEWMHRYIDRDLDEEESAVLLQHIHACSNCAEEFEMLNMLSAQLEQLPKVTPKFSLVDSILPQLDAIDQARREEGSAVEIISEVIPAVSADRSGNLRSRSNRPQTSKRRRAYVSGTLGLTAALIIGMFIYQYEPRTISDAEIALSSSYNQNTASTQSTSAADEAAPADSMANSSNDIMDGAADSFSTQEAQNAGNADENSAVAADVPSSGSGGKSAEPAAPAPSPSKTVDKGVNTPSDSTKGSAPAATTAPSNEKALPVNEENAAGSENGSADLPQNEAGDSMMMGLTRLSANEWPSPDGKYVVELQDEYVQLYEYMESQEPKLLSEAIIDGEWVSGEWAEDGLIFTYEVEKNGVLAEHTLTPVQK